MLSRWLLIAQPRILQSLADIGRRFPPVLTDHVPRSRVPRPRRFAPIARGSPSPSAAPPTSTLPTPPRAPRAGARLAASRGARRLGRRDRRRIRRAIRWLSDEQLHDLTAQQHLPRRGILTPHPPATPRLTPHPPLHRGAQPHPPHPADRVPRTKTPVIPDQHRPGGPRPPRARSIPPIDAPIIPSRVRRCQPASVKSKPSRITHTLLRRRNSPVSQNVSVITHRALTPLRRGDAFRRRSPKPPRPDRCPRRAGPAAMGAWRRGPGGAAS
jgi:hypothetical protein